MQFYPVHPTDFITQATPHNHRPTSLIAIQQPGEGLTLTAARALSHLARAGSFGVVH